MLRRKIRLAFTAVAALMMMVIIGLTSQPSGVAIGALPFFQPVNTPDPNPTPAPDPGGDSGDTTLNRAPVQSIGYENLGNVILVANAAQFVYASPGGELVIIGNNALTLPADADNNGFDTYVVTGLATVEDELWLALFIGSENPVWIPASRAAQVALRLSEAVTSNAGF